MYKTEKTFNVIQGKVPDFSGVYKEKLLNGADPVLSGDLVPVNINLENGTVTKADTAKQWYKYEDKQWANAVILKEGVETPADNTEIEEENIESYFVWIPKYRYKIFDLGNTYTGLATVQADKTQQIEIEFGLTNTQDGIENECVAPVSGSNGECKKDYWMTHPAFTAFNTNGIWVGKFETGYKDASSAANAQKNDVTTSGENSKVIIKPNVYSWRSITIKNMFDASYYYQRNLDSHMMKNTEWGAVAYLQHSKYGSELSLRNNNNSGYMTGYAATTEPTTGYNTNNNDYETPSGLGKDGTKTVNYKNLASNVASTTNNYTGVYDMSGGAWELTMGVMKGSTNNSFVFGSSGFSTNTFPFKSGEENSKYYDIYDYNTSGTTYNRRILGDATGEMGPFGQKNYSGNIRYISSWYADEAWFTYNGNSWFSRGGAFNYGIESGVFAFSQNTGGADVRSGFRIVLSPKI